MTKKGKNKTLLDKISLNFKKIIIANIILNVVFLIMGIAIYLKPLITLTLAGILIGIYLVSFGLFDIYEYMMRKENPMFSLKLFLGILAVILGIFTMINPFKILTIITLGLGIYLCLVAIFKIIDAFKLKKYGFDGWAITLVISIIILIFGVLVTINPLRAIDIVEVAGLFIILTSILEICNLIMFYSKSKEIQKLFK